MRPLCRSEGPPAIVLLHQLLNRRLDVLLLGRRLPRRHRRQGHSPSDQRLAPNAPLAAAVLLLVHQVAYAATHASGVATQKGPNPVKLDFLSM